MLGALTVHVTCTDVELRTTGLCMLTTTSPNSFCTRRWSTPCAVGLISGYKKRVKWIYLFFMDPMGVQTLTPRGSVSWPRILWHGQEEPRAQPLTLWLVDILMLITYKYLQNPFPIPCVRTGSDMGLGSPSPWALTALMMNRYTVFGRRSLTMNSVVFTWSATVCQLLLTDWL